VSIHETVTVHEGAVIAESVSIGAYSVIGPNVRIGPGTVIRERVTIAGQTSIGSECRIYTGAVVGSDPQDLKYAGEDTAVVVGDRTKIREYVTVNKGTAGGGGITRVGSDCLLMAYSHVAHDCTLEDHVIMANIAELAGHVLVERGASISGLVGVHHFASIGRLAFIGGLSKITRDAPPFMISQGNPARVRGANVVGLQRSGVSRESIKALRQACRLLYHSELAQDVALEKVRAEGLTESPEVQYLLDFLNRSKDGALGRAREASREE
jgi:UDP-N-acetylglucosamine acyltransferase